MIIDDYIEYTRTYKAKYGEKCIVLMQVGSFYEMYSIIDDTSEDIYNIADICNIQISRKNKNIKDVSISNPLMAGFPLYTLQKFTGILLNNNYTIVLIEQVTEPPNPQRRITDILSPGMNMNVSTKKNNFMMVIYYEIINDLPVVGITGIDLSTGNCFVYEAGSSKSDPEFANDEVYRIIATYNPCEIVILSDKKLDEYWKTYLLKNLNLRNVLVHYKWDTFEYIKSMQKLSFQNAILEKAFMNKKEQTMLSITESLNLEKYNYGRIALCCLLQFAYEHNADIIQHLNLPEIINDDMHLNIEYNSAVQLNVLGLYNNDRPLVDILNRCQTAFGSRVFRERLLKPIVDPDKLNRRYDAIAFLLEDCKFKKVNRHLGQILDLERIKRKMIIGKYNPQDWCGLNTSLENAVEILDKYISVPIEELTEYKDIIDYYTNILDLNEASKYNVGDIKSNIFLKGIYAEVDKHTQDFEEAYQKIIRTCNSVNQLDSVGDSTSCKIEYSDKDGYYLSMTKKRYENAKAKNSAYLKEFQVKTAGTVTTNLKLVNEDIVVASGIMEDKQQLISKSVTEYYQKFVAEFLEKYSGIFDRLIKTIIDIDINACNARNAFEYRYYRPEIGVEGSDRTGSYLNVENLRHPIIERIDESTPYVGNDIRLSRNGMLLYGINAAGKSSLMKSVGLAIIMAQAGMFVPASRMQYYPYKHIFTRISGMDNIFKGMSSFTVEMTELRNILQRCDKFSLVLGDEICSGTEATSALAIVAAGLDTLVTKQASFIFATHLHQLTELDIVKMHLKDKIAVKHIHITIDEQNRIVYERKLKDGQGSATYGIEVCKSLDMPVGFMKIAEGVRKQIEGHTHVIVNLERSKYNKDIYMSSCNICGEPAEDTHHIQYQCESDADGNFRDFHKNTKHNLVPLCKECHKKEHSGEIDIKGYKKTSSGVVIDVSVNPKSPGSVETENLGLSEDDIQTIKQYIRRGKCHWYMRSAKTHTFKKCTDENKVIDRIHKILKKVVIHTLQEQDLYNVLYEPTL